MTALSREIFDLDGLNNQFVLYDGSGLSSDNRLSPRQVVTVMRMAINDMAIGPEFLASLSRFGNSGTLRKRKLEASEILRTNRVLSFPRVVDSVWGKTGSLNTVSSIAGVAPLGGYIHVRSGGSPTESEPNLAAFVIVTNGSFDHGSARNLQDRIVNEIIRN